MVRLWRLTRGRGGAGPQCAVQGRRSDAGTDVIGGDRLDERGRQAYLIALGRPPTEKETAALSAYASRHGLANACRVLFNCNEFLFVP